MDTNVIIQQESENDGQTILLFYDDLAGMYLAFGLSAYYTTMVTEPTLSFSDEVQMPVALLNRANVLYLRQSLQKKEHQKRTFYRFQAKRYLGDAGYEKWANKIISRHNITNSK